MPSTTFTAVFVTTVSGALLASTGCVGDRGSSNDPDTTPIDWQPCGLLGDGSDDAECALVSLPLRYDPPSGAFDVWVKRLPAASASRGQLWLLDGGPGGGATNTLAQRMADIADLTGDLDIYTFDHRGAGRSGRLGCPQEGAQSDGGLAITEAEWPQCSASLIADDVPLEDVTTTAAAWDLGTLIQRTSAQDEVVFVWGISYGTYHAQRYLQLFPDQPTGVILEAIAPASTDWSSFDQRFSKVARSIVERCADDPSCASRLGPDPWSYVSQARTIVDSGECNLGIDGATWGQLLGLLLYNDALREIVPALAYRATRCSVDDLNAYAQLFKVIGGLGGAGSAAIEDLNSTVLFNHIWSSEGWAASGPPQLSELQRIADDCVLCLGSGPRLAARYDDWPRYTTSSADKDLANYTGPLLMMQGALDPATPLAGALALQEHFTATNQTFAVFPAGGHGISGGTPFPRGDCGYTIYAEFLRDPTAELDTTCIADVRPLRFDGDPAIVQLLLGTSNLWGD